MLHVVHLKYKDQSLNTSLLEYLMCVDYSVSQSSRDTFTFLDQLLVTARRERKRNNS